MLLAVYLTSAAHNIIETVDLSLGLIILFNLSRSVGISPSDLFKKQQILRQKPEVSSYIVGSFIAVCVSLDLLSLSYKTAKIILVLTLMAVVYNPYSAHCVVWNVNHDLYFM